MWYYTKDGYFPKECFGCLCEVINADSEKTYEVFCYNPKTEFWYDSWGDPVCRGFLIYRIIIGEN